MSRGVGGEAARRPWPKDGTGRSHADAITGKNVIIVWGGGGELRRDRRTLSSRRRYRLQCGLLSSMQLMQRQKPKPMMKGEGCAGCAVGLCRLRLLPGQANLGLIEVILCEFQRVPPSLVGSENAQAKQAATYYHGQILSYGTRSQGAVKSPHKFSTTPHSGPHSSISQ